MDIKNYFSKIIPEVTAEAHCDIPCGIYEPTAAKVAAMTVLRMVLQIGELQAPAGMDAHAMSAHANMIARRIAVKEEHADAVKRELLTLWSDFFKPEHVEKFPRLHDIFWQAAKLASKNKQEVSEEAARQLVAAVDEIARMFYEAKGVPERYEAYKTLTDKLF